MPAIGNSGTIPYYSFFCSSASVINPPPSFAISKGQNFSSSLSIHLTEYGKLSLSDMSEDVLILPSCSFYVSFALFFTGI